MGRRRGGGRVHGGARERRPSPRRTAHDNVRVAAAWVVERTLASHAPADLFLDSALSRFDERDRGLLRELALGTLRWLRRLDHVLATASHRRFEEIEPELHAPLRVGAYQLLFLDRVPAHAAVHEAVEQARSLTHRGGASFVNAVLRRIGRSPRLSDWPVREEDDARRLATLLSHPDFLTRRWIERFGWDRARRLLQANNRDKPFQLLAFRDRGGRELLAEGLIDEGLEVEPCRLSPLGLTVRQGNPLVARAFARGDAYVQDEASQVAALLPPPAPGERVLDVAAAPGGKSFAILAHEPGVRIVAADGSLPRLLRMRVNLQRLRRRVPLAVADASSVCWRGRFDRVVLDLPCSGTGTFRRHPELKWRLSPGEIDRLAAQGLEWLRAAAALVEPGGLLAAITCSLEREENEAVVDRFLEDERGFERLDLRGRVPPTVESALESPTLWRLLPEADHDGFTVQVLRRRRP